MVARSAGIEALDLEISFPPLWTPTASETASIAKQKTEVIVSAFQAGLLDAGVAMQELKKLEDETGLFGSLTDQLIEAAKGKTYQDVTALRDPLAGLTGGQNSPFDISAVDSVPTADYSPDQPRDEHGRWTNGSFSEGSYTKQSEHAILETSNKIGVNPDVNFICDLDPNIYNTVSSEVTTSHVIITDKQLEHIRERHPDISETVMEQLEQIIRFPDYIIETDKPNTANILKHLEINGKGYQLILRIRTNKDPQDFQNSIITFMSVNEKRYQQYLRNRKILYKRE